VAVTAVVEAMVAEVTVAVLRMAVVVTVRRTLLLRMVAVTHRLLRMVVVTQRHTLLRTVPKVTRVLAKAVAEVAVEAEVTAPVDGGAANGGAQDGGAQDGGALVGGAPVGGAQDGGTAVTATSTSTQQLPDVRAIRGLRRCRRAAVRTRSRASPKRYSTLHTARCLPTTCNRWYNSLRTVTFIFTRSKTVRFSSGSALTFQQAPLVHRELRPCTRTEFKPARPRCRSQWRLPAIRIE